MHLNRLADPFNLSFTKTRTAKFVALCVMLTIGFGSGLSGCSRGDSPAAGEARGDEMLTAPSDLENNETQVRITVPDGWMAVRNGKRGAADIYASYEPAKLYAVVLSESISVLSQFDLENNAEQYRWLIREELDRFDGETPTKTDSIDGNSAVQYEIRGQVDGVPVVYLHTTVKGDSDYYQVVGWTTADSYRDNQEILQGIIKSFRGS